MASAPAYVATPKAPYVQATAANTARDGTGTLATLHTAGASGGRLEGITGVHTGTSTTGVLRFYLSNDGGTTKRLIGELLVTAITPSTTVAVWSGLWIPPGGVLILAASAIVYVSTHNAETFNVFGNKAGDF